MRKGFLLLGLTLALVIHGGVAAFGQGVEYRLDKSGQWEVIGKPTEDADAAVISQARTHLAEGRTEKAKLLLDAWLEEHENDENQFLPQAYLLRGDALTASGYEYKALYDYEAVIKRFPASEEFITALERELDIATKYVNGLKYKWLGVRVWDAKDIGAELLVVIQERLPNSRLAERAGIELAEYYYRDHDLRMADVAYEMFLLNYPNSAYQMSAMKRRVYSAIGQYKGPMYDSTSLRDARALIKRFAALYPAEAEKAGLNDALVARLDESAAAELLESARWYMKQGDSVSARFTLQRLVNKYPSTAAGALALQVLTERGWLDTRPPEDPNPGPFKPEEPEAPAPAAPRPAATKKEGKP